MTRPSQHDFFRDGGDVLTLPHLQQSERIQRAHDVVHLHGGPRATRHCLVQRRPDVLQTARTVRVSESLHDGVRPVAAVADASEVAERLLWRAHLVLPLRQLVGEGDQELAVARALDERHAADTSEIVSFLRVLVFREVSDLEWRAEKKDTMWLPSSSSSHMI